MNKKAATEYLVQAVLIIFSVLLALFLNENREDVKEKREAQKIIRNIMQEIRSNKEINDWLLPYHNEVLERLRKAKQEPALLDSLRTKKGLAFNKIAPRGIIQNLVGKTAWETAKVNSAISQIDFQKLQTLTRVYNQQETTLMVVIAIGELLTSREYLDPELAEENLQILIYHFNELRGREIRLNQYYEEALAILP